MINEMFMVFWPKCLNFFKALTCFHSFKIDGRLYLEGHAVVIERCVHCGKTRGR